MMAFTSNPTSTLTSKYLHSRISFLTTTLIKRFENILALSLDETDLGGASPGRDDNNDNSTDAKDEHDGKSANTKQDSIHGNGNGGMRVGVEKMSETKAIQLQMQIETAGLVRAAEEVLGLSRGVKEVWAYGDFDVDRGVGRGEDGRNGGEGRDGGDGRDGGREQDRVLEGEEKEEAVLIEEETSVKAELQEFLERWYRRQRRRQQQQQQSTVAGGGEDEQGGEMEGIDRDDDKEGMDTG